MHRRIIILLLLLLSIGSIVVSFEPQHVETVPTSRTEAILTQNGEKDPDESPKVPQEYRQEVFDAILVQTPSGPVPISRLVQVKSRTVPIDQQYELHPDVLLLTDGSEHFKAFNQIWYGIKQLFRFSTMKSLLWSTWNGATGLLKFSTWKSIIWSSWDLFKRSPSLFWNTSRGLIGGLWSLQGLKTVLLWSMWSPILGSIAALMLGLSFTTLFGTLLGAGFLYWFFHAPRAKTFEGRKVPLPPGYRFNWGRWKLPIFGDTFDFLRSPFVFTDTMAKRFGNVSYSNLWFSNTILLSGKSGMRSFYNQELVGRGSSFPSHFSSTSLGRKVEDRKLDAQRSILVKAVANQTRLDNFTTDIESTIDRYIFNWSSKKHFKFSDELQLLGAELTSKFLLGVTDKDMNRKISNYNTSILLGNESLPMPVPYLFNFGNGLLASRRVRQLYTEIIDHHLAGKTEYPNKYPYIRRGSAMDVIASDLKKSNLIVTKKDVVWELYHMFLASHQLVGNAMTDMMICFSRYPDIFNKARREVFNNLQPTDRLSVDKLQNLPYIDAIVDEVRRCFAFVPYQSGYAKKDFEVDGFLVPKGYKLMGCFYATNHDYNLWSQPYTFRPERFGNGEPRSNEKYPFTFNNQSWAWVPHGAANHMCPGTDLTTYILKIAAIEIIRKGCSWDVPSQDLKSKLPLYNPRPENGFQIRNFRSQQLSTA